MGRNKIMLNNSQKLLSKLDRWVCLGDLFDEKNLINSDFNDFLQMFSSDNRLIFINILQYGILSGMTKNKAEEHLPILIPQIVLEDIPKYLSHDDFIVFPVTNSKSIGEDYLKSEKRKDLITRISIIRRNYNVPFSNISHIDPHILAGFKIICSYKSKGHYRRDIDLIANWNLFDDNSEITIDGDLVPIISLEEE
jgi:hypothetical protein